MPRPNLLRRVCWVTCIGALLSMPFVAAWSMLRWSSPGVVLSALMLTSIAVSLFACLITLSRARHLPRRVFAAVAAVSVAVSVTLGLGIGLLWREDGVHRWALKQMVERAQAKELRGVFESEYNASLEDACLAVASSEDPALQQLLLAMMGAHPMVAKRCLALTLPPWERGSMSSAQSSRMDVVLRRWWNEMYEDEEGGRGKNLAQAIASLDSLSSSPHTMLLACSLTHPDPTLRAYCHTLLHQKLEAPKDLVFHILERPEALSWAPQMRQAMVDASFLGQGVDGRSLGEAGIDSALYTSSSLQVVALDLSCQVLEEKGLSQDAERAVARAVKKLCALNLPPRHVRPKEIWQAVCQAPLLENKLKQTVCPVAQVASALQLVEHAIFTASNQATAGSKESASATFAKGVDRAASAFARPGYDIQSLQTQGQLYNESTEALRRMQEKTRAGSLDEALAKERKAYKPAKKPMTKEELDEIFAD